MRKHHKIIITLLILISTLLQGCHAPLAKPDYEVEGRQLVRDVKLYKRTDGNYDMECQYLYNASSITDESQAKFRKYNIVISPDKAEEIMHTEDTLKDYFEDTEERLKDYEVYKEEFNKPDISFEEYMEQDKESTVEAFRDSVLLDTVEDYIENCGKHLSFKSGPDAIIEFLNNHFIGVITSSELSLGEKIIMCICNPIWIWLGLIPFCIIYTSIKKNKEELDKLDEQ